MVSSSAGARVSIRLAIFFLLLLLVAFYFGRPLYWKLSATIHDIQRNKQTVKQGFSQFVLDARRSVGWESDSGLATDSTARKVGKATNRRILRLLDHNLNGKQRS